MTNLKQRTVSGIIWNFAEQIGRKGIGVIITLLLARFLVPADYGLVAMMAVFLAVATSLMDSGFTQALIRLPDAKPSDFNTAFYANLALGLLAYVLLFMAAPLIVKDSVFISPNVMTIFSTHEGKFIKETLIESMAFIGTAAVIGPGVKIGKKVVIGSMAYVSKDCLEPGTYIGVPAKKHIK